MHTSSELFGLATDWLTHTLSHSDSQIPSAASTLTDGTGMIRRDVGILELTPPSTTPNPNHEALIISAGVHGNETAPIEVLNELVSDILRGDLPITCPLLLILGNPPAMVAGERFLDVNMNRLFAGAHAKAEYQNFPEAHRAAELERLCREFSDRHSGLALSHYDLHTAIRPSCREKFALYPFVEGREVPASQCRFLLEADVETLLLQHKAGTTFSSFTSSKLGAESFTIELGKVQPFGENDHGRFSGIREALRRRFSGEPSPASAENLGRLTVYEVVHEVLNTGQGFRFHVADDASNFTEYAPGTVIWEDERTCYRVGDRPEAIVFPNRQVPVGQRAGLMIRPQNSSGA